MANVHYTPTHCPDTGRKFTRAERKAANKAKFQATLTSKPSPAKASKSKRKSASKPAKAERPTLTAKQFEGMVKRNMRLTKAQLVDIIMSGYEVKSEPASKPASKPTSKRKPKRMSKNTKLEVQAQRMSRGTAQTYIAPEDTKVKNGKKMTYAEYVNAHKSDYLFGRDGEIVGVDTQALADRANAKQYPEYAELRDAGYSVEDAVRYVLALMDGAPAPVEATDELPF